jgi:imidazolonepropionase-like amidohydrolase
MMQAIKCGKIRTITKGIIENGVILVKDGKIVDVGNILIPEDAEVLDASKYEVMPGMIDAHTHIGLISEGVGEDGNDSNERTDPVTPHVRALDGFDPFDNAVKEVMEAGVTTVLVTPGSANCIGGQCSVIKTFGNTVDNMLLVENAGMKFATGENPKRVYGSQNKLPSTRMGIAALIRDSLTKAISYGKKKEEAAKKGELEKFDIDLKMEALQGVVAGKTKARFHCHTSYDIRTAIRIADEFKLDITLEHCTEGLKIIDDIVSRKIPVVLSPLINARGKYETRERMMENAGLFAENDALVVISTDGISQQARWLPLNAGLCIRYGMKEEEAFKAITINAAKVLGIDDVLGSIEPGKDADLVITDGHPLETRTRTALVMINGKITYKQKGFFTE